MSIGNDIEVEQLWFRQVNNDLEISVIGTGDSMTVANWYSGSQYHVEQFQTSDGKILSDNHVQTLVHAMAGFSRPSAGQTALPAGYRNSLASVIAASWQ